MGPSVFRGGIGMAEKERADPRCLDVFTLKCIAMAAMFCDHAWSTVAPGSWVWLTCIGRIAFPIFAFQLAEGFQKTHDRGKYLRRMFLFALISEIPFNYLTEGGPVNPFHQNVMFTFCIALLAMTAIEWGKTKGRVQYWVVLVLSCLLGVALGFAAFVDYFGYGVATVLLFYLFHGKRFGWIPEILGMWYINWELGFPLAVAGHELWLPEQGFALLALIPIFLYNGKRGPHSKRIQYACYAFYPAHMVLLVGLSYLIR